MLIMSFDSKRNLAQLKIFLLETFASSSVFKEKTNFSF